MITIQTIKTKTEQQKSSLLKAFSLSTISQQPISPTLFFDAIEEYVKTSDVFYKELAVALTRRKEIDWSLTHKFSDKWRYKNSPCFNVMDKIIKESDWFFMKEKVVDSLLKVSNEQLVELGFSFDDDGNVRIDARKKVNPSTKKEKWIGEKDMCNVFLSVEEFIDMSYTQFKENYINV